jgi:YHS domain-containing protein
MLPHLDRNASCRAKRRSSAGLWRNLVSAGLIIGMPLVALPLRAAETPAAVETIGVAPIVMVEPRSGAALFGYDPVSYFLAGAAVPGNRSHVALWGGAEWRFASAANREQFLRAPDRYLPVGGGYDPIRLAEGAPAPADPTIFVVEDGMLWLFRSKETQDVFRNDGKRRLAAMRHWLTVLKQH